MRTSVVQRYSRSFEDKNFNTHVLLKLFFYVRTHIYQNDETITSSELQTGLEDVSGVSLKCAFHEVWYIAR